MELEEGVGGTIMGVTEKISNLLGVQQPDDNDEDINIPLKVFQHKHA